MADTEHEGKCACGEIHYKVHGAPMFVHCCHCRWCQRETGAAFALNAMFEADRVEVTKGKPEAVENPSESGNGQTIWRCPTCKNALWSNYAGAGPAINFVRVGTLLNPDAMPPDIHIFTSSKQPWVTLDDGKPQFAEFYRRSEVWPAEAYARREAAMKKLEN